MSGSLPQHQSEPATAHLPRESSPAAQISNLVVGLLRSYTGRGPTRAWTTIEADLVSVVLRDTLTTGERSLVSDGRPNLVLDMRKAYQMSMRAELVSGVERITGRKVIAFLSDNHIDPDIAIESFVLEPSSNNNAHSDGASAAEALLHTNNDHADSRPQRP